MLHLLSTQVQSSGQVEVWISHMGIVANVLNQYDSFCIIARTIFESKMKYSLLNISLVSSFTKFHNIFDMTAAFNSALTTKGKEILILKETLSMANNSWKKHIQFFK